MQLPRYVVVSPVKDEAEHLNRTAASLVAQTHQPAQWVIVDDGSRDATAEIAGRWAADHDWITLARSDSNGTRARGGRIVRAFNHGYGLVDVDHEVVVKLDGDLHLPSHYFHWVLATFGRDSRAGIVGGIVHGPDGPEWRPDRVSRRSVHGVAKAYRTACLDAIGGLQESMGWDGIDEYAARARGWHVHVLTELAILHYRPRGSKQRWWRARWEEGRGNHYMGYIPSALALRAAYRMIVERPPFLGGLVLAAGFAWASITNRARTPDDLARTQLRLEQRARWRRLATGRQYLDAAPLDGGGPAYWRETSEGAPHEG